MCLYAVGFKEMREPTTSLAVRSFLFQFCCAKAVLLFQYNNFGYLLGCLNRLEVHVALDLEFFLFFFQDSLKSNASSYLLFSIFYTKEYMSILVVSKGIW
jgi:hypothetical protein